MDCWIGVVHDNDGCLVRLAGRLTAVQVPQLFEACERPLRIDLTELVSADSAGVEALQRLRDQGAKLFAASGYLQMKIDSPSPGAAMSSPPKRPGAK